MDLKKKKKKKKNFFFYRFICFDNFIYNKRFIFSYSYEC